MTVFFQLNFTCGIVLMCTPSAADTEFLLTSCFFMSARESDASVETKQAPASQDGGEATTESSPAK